MDKPYGRNRQSVADIQEELNRIFKGHPKSHINPDGQPVIPADAIVDVLFSFSDAFDGIPLLSPEEQEGLDLLLQANTGLEVTPDILLQFIAQKTAATPSPPTTPNEVDDANLSDRGRSDERNRPHSRSSSNESNTGYYHNSSRPPSRGPPQTPGSGRSAFDAPNRQRSTPLVSAAPSSWAKRPPAHRRKSDAGNRSDSDSGTPSFNRSNFRSRGPSNPVSPTSSSLDLTFSPGSSPTPYSRPPSRQHAPPISGGFAAIHFDDGYSSPDETIHQNRRRSIGNSGGLNTVPLPRLGGSNPDVSHNYDSDDEDAVLRMLAANNGRGTLDSNASMDDQARIHTLQRALEEMQKKKSEMEDNYDKKIAEHEADYAELQAALDQMRDELASTQRDEKELRSKERQSNVTIAQLEAEVARVNKSLQSTKETYSRLQKNYAEQLALSEKYRADIIERDRLIRAAESRQAAADHEREKLEKERLIYEERILALEQEVSVAQDAFAALESQKTENLLLKETIDRMRHEISEYREKAAAGAVAGEAGSSADASGHGSLMAELVGKGWERDEEQTHSEADTSTDTAVEEGDESEDEDIVQTIITRKKRKVASKAAIEQYQRREFEEAKEYSDTGVQYDPTYFCMSRSAQTDGPPKVLTASFSTQTDEIPEPVAAKSTSCEMEIQTDEVVEEPSRSPSPRNLESLASSSSTVVPPTPKPLKRPLDDIDPTTVPLDQPPAYSQVTGGSDSWSLVADVLKKWHSGAKMPVEPVAGGVAQETAEEWKAIKEELGVGCAVIDKIIESSGPRVPKSDSDKGKGSRRNRFYNIYNTYVYGSGANGGGAGSTILGQTVMVVGASALVMLAISPYVAPHYAGVPGGATYYDRAAWNSFNSLGVAGEGFAVGAAGDGTAAVWNILGRIGGGAARMARAWPT